jgi:hypothetical protein
MRTKVYIDVFIIIKEKRGKNPKVALIYDYSNLIYFDLS